jgi:hypothetical protein
MNQIDVARTIFTAIEQLDYDTVKAHLTSDFAFSGPVPQPVNADQWLGVQYAVSMALPDFSFNVMSIKESGNIVTATIQITGNHEGTFDLSPLGLPVVPPTGRYIRLPVETPVFTFYSGKVQGVDVAPVEGGGVAGILMQMGVQLPH